MKTEIVFKLEKTPVGFNQVLAPNCQVKIGNTSGTMYLNYEYRTERAVGRYENLRREGEQILADVELFDKLKVIEDRIEYAIAGAVISKNSEGEAELILIASVAALMHNKF